MANVTRKIERNKSKADGFDIEGIKSDIIEAQRLVDDALAETRLMLEGGMKSLKDVEDSTFLYGMLEDKLDSLDSMAKDKEALDVRIDKGMTELKSKDDIDASIEVGEVIGEYNMLHTEVVGITGALLDIALGDAKDV